MLALDLGSGQTATLVSSDGEACVLCCSRAAPPGSTLEGTVHETLLRVKVRSCRRDDASPTEPFRVEGRFVSLTRVQRELVRAC